MTAKLVSSQSESKNEPNTRAEHNLTLSPNLFFWHPRHGTVGQNVFPMYISIKWHSWFFKSWWCLLYFGHVQTWTAGKCWRQKTPFCLELSSNAQKSVLSWSISISRILDKAGYATVVHPNSLSVSTKILTDIPLLISDDSPNETEKTKFWKSFWTVHLFKYFLFARKAHVFYRIEMVNKFIETHSGGDFWILRIKWHSYRCIQYNSKVLPGQILRKSDRRKRYLEDKKLEKIVGFHGFSVFFIHQSVSRLYTHYVYDWFSSGCLLSFTWGGSHTGMGYIYLPAFWCAFSWNLA